MNIRNARTVSYKQALAIIQQENALVKMISVNPQSDRCLDFVLNQLGDLANCRPVANLNLGQYARHRVWNPLTDVWSYRDVEYVQRGKAKPHAQYTKKTSVTLLPSDGQIKLFQPKHGHPIGLLLDLRDCHLKDEKYVFPVSALTSSRFWIKNTASLPKVKSIGLQGLRDKLRAERLQKIVPEENELLVGIRKEALRGLVVTEYDVESRLKALYLQAKIQERFQINLPILIVQLDNAMHEYHAQYQRQDLIFHLKQRTQLPTTFLQTIRSHFSDDDNVKIDNEVHAFDVDSHELDIVRFISVGAGVQWELSLSYLSLAELYALRKNLPEFQSEVEIQSSLEKAIRQVDKLADLKQTIALARPIMLKNKWDFPSAKEINGKKYADLIKLVSIPFFRLIENIYKVSDLHEEILNRICSHLVEGDATSFSDALKKLCLSEKLSAIALMLLSGKCSQRVRASMMVVALKEISLIPLMRSIQGVKSHAEIGVFYYFSGYDSEGRRQLDHRYYSVSLLCLATFTDKYQAASVLAERFPGELVSAIQFIGSVLKNKCDFLSLDKPNLRVDFKTLKQSQGYLLTLLKPQHAYKIRYDEKRQLEKYLLSELNQLTKPEEVKLFWDKYADSYAVNQRRHSIYDRLFRKPGHETCCKKTLETAVKVKFASLEVNPSSQAGVKSTHYSLHRG